MAQPRARSGEIISLRPLGERLPGSRTTALLKARQLELVRLVLRAGDGLREHQAPGEITVQCLEGQIEFRLPGGVHRLGPGDLIHLAPRETHALTALTDASVLVTLCLVKWD